MELRPLDGPEIVEGLRLAHVAREHMFDALEALRSDPTVAYAEPDYIWRKEAVPNDQYYPQMWELKNTGQAGGMVGTDIHAEAAWDITTGSKNVVVGVIDEGIDINHPDLKNNIWVNPGEIPGNGIDDDGNGFIDDVHGWNFIDNNGNVYGGSPTDFDTDAHGTHVAGTIGAEGNNGVGVVGVNWQVSLMSLKVLGPQGGSISTIVKAYSYAKMMRDLWVSTGGAKGANIRVLNNSYGGRGFSQAAQDAIRALSDSGILFVVAAGNNSSDNDRVPVYPANFKSPNIISVAAMNSGDYISSFSNYGATSVNLAAPGEKILSTTPNATYSFASGTSMAAPHVSGVAALVCAANPGISMTRLRAALIFSGDKVQSAAGNPVQTGLSLNALGALQNATINDTTAPAAPTIVSSSVTGRILTMNVTGAGDDGASGTASIYELRYSDSDLSSSSQFDQARPFGAPVPVKADSTQAITLAVPYRHTSGFVGIRAVDKAGNVGPITSIPVSVDVNSADPYVVTEGSPLSLSTGGTPLGLKADDQYRSYALPFSMPFFGTNQDYVALSTNGALYMRLPNTPFPPSTPDGFAADAISSVQGLNGYSMVAGLWDDLRTDRNSSDDIYVVTPDPSRIIFRWQAVTFDLPLGNGVTRGEHPVNFEIELRRDGTIQVRYGDGNQRLFPVVGASAGDPDAYPVASHTSELQLMDLTNAPAVTFTPRNPVPFPTNDLAISVKGTPNAVVSGKQLEYSFSPTSSNLGTADQTVISDQLSPQTTFVSCTVSQGSCTGPPVGQTGQVTANFGKLLYAAYFTVVVQVTAPANTVIANTATISGYWTDPNPSNNTATETTPVLSSIPFSGVKAISAGGSHTLALKADGTVWAWGANDGGELGNGTYFSSLVPVPVSGLTGVVAIAAGDAYSLALKSDNTVWAWGGNYYGELGTHAVQGSDTPIQVTGVNGITALAAGDLHVVALKNDGTVWTWGGLDDNYQQIYTPYQVAGLTNVISVGAGTASNYKATSFAVKADGTVWGWGANDYGQAGQPSVAQGGPMKVLAPTQVGGLSNVASVTAGAFHTAALKRDGTVWSWGADSSGQLGDNGAPPGGVTGPSPGGVPPVQAVGLANVVAVAAGGSHTLALKSDGTIWAWGSNANGQLGNGRSTGFSDAVTVPTQIQGISGALSLTAGLTDSGAVMPDSTLLMWGNNDMGQLGDATQVTRYTPVGVSGVQVVSPITFSPDGGNYQAIRVVSLNCATPGAVIHYTLNGGIPTEADPSLIPGASLTIGSNVLLQAKAWATGYLASGVHSAYFFVNIPPNNIDDATFFVTQHYQDFLSRSPDAGGLNYWVSQITQCGSDNVCIHNKRVDVSNAFFYEQEFQSSGAFVYRVYKAAFGQNPTFAQFLPDRETVVGGSQLDASKTAFALAFVQRSEFVKAYPQSQSASQFVDSVLSLILANSQADLSSQRATLIGLYDGTDKGRAAILRQIADDQTFVDAEYNRSFVLTQYFGYLRRDADSGGFNFWLGQINNFPIRNVPAQHALVCSFITSAEYQLRFGTSVTHSNSECPQ